MARKLEYSERKFDVKKKQAYDNAYQKANYDRINFLMVKGTKERIAERATQEGVSASEWLRTVIDNALNSK